MLHRRLLLTGAAFVAPALFTPRRAAAQEVTLRLHHFLPAVSNVHRHFLVPWANKVREESGGRLRIQIFPSMQLGGAPPQLYDQVKDGVALVNRAGASLTEIVDSIKTVAAIVADIANASAEQASGIEQVNKALNQMDEVTQQNSALVEENAATAKTLEHQAKAMDDHVAIFKLGNDDDSRWESPGSKGFQHVA